MRTINATREGTCPACRGLVRIGDDIANISGQWQHVTCAQDEVVPDSPAPQQRGEVKTMTTAYMDDEIRAAKERLAKLEAKRAARERKIDARASEMLRAAQPEAFEQMRAKAIQELDAKETEAKQRAKERAAKAKQAKAADPVQHHE